MMMMMIIIIIIAQSSVSRTEKKFRRHFTQVSVFQRRLLGITRKDNVNNEEIRRSRRSWKITERRLIWPGHVLNISRQAVRWKFEGYGRRSGRPRVLAYISYQERLARLNLSALKLRRSYLDLEFRYKILSKLVFINFDFSRLILSNVVISTSCTSLVAVEMRVKTFHRASGTLDHLMQISHR